MQPAAIVPLPVKHVILITLYCHWLKHVPSAMVLSGSHLVPIAALLPSNAINVILVIHHCQMLEHVLHVMGSWGSLDVLSVTPLNSNVSLAPPTTRSRH